MSLKRTLSVSWFVLEFRIMKTRIYLVRHCESEGNLCRRNHAQFDGIVTKKGLLQAQALCERFKDEKIDGVYSSDAFRAVTTAEPVARSHNLEVQLRRLWREYTIGIWEGTSIGWTAYNYPKQWNSWVREPWNHNIPGAEKFTSVAQRGMEAIRQMVAEHPGGTMIAVSHVTTIISTLTAVLGRDITWYPNINGGENTAVTLIEVSEDGSMNVPYISDISHLPPQLRRSDYTGRGIEGNFYYFDAVRTEPQILRRMVEGLASQEGIPADGICQDLLRKQEDLAIVPYLTGTPGGIVIGRVGDPRLPADHGLIEGFWIAPEITVRAMAAQAFGEMLDRLRRRGMRWIVVRDSDEPNLKFCLDRLPFEDMGSPEGYRRLYVRVPGIEGPVY